MDTYYHVGKTPHPICFTLPRLCPGSGYKAAAQNIFVKWTELNLSQVESSTQEEVLINKGAGAAAVGSYKVSTRSEGCLEASFIFLLMALGALAADNRL